MNTKRITKYIPEIPNPPARDLDEARRIALQICEAFAANFQNDETDLAHMITDRFMLREFDKVYDYPESMSI